MYTYIINILVLSRVCRLVDFFLLKKNRDVEALEIFKPLL